MNYMIAYEPRNDKHKGLVSIYNTDLMVQKQVFYDILKEWIIQGRIQVNNIKSNGNKLTVSDGSFNDYIPGEKVILTGYNQELGTVSMLTQQGQVICDKVKNVFSQRQSGDILNKGIIIDIPLPDGIEKPIIDTTDELSRETRHIASGKDSNARYCKYGRVTGIYTGNDKEVVIPMMCKGIGDDTFRGNTTLEVVKFGGNIEYIGNRAFEGCVNLREVRSNCQVKEIGDYVFKDCCNLAVVELFITTKMGKGVFDGCTKLRKAGVIR